MKNYFLYGLSILVGFILWAAIFWLMSKPKFKSKNLMGFLLAGPAHSILKRRDSKLSMREIVGWAIVLILMLLAPIISFWMEKGG